MYYMVHRVQSTSPFLYRVDILPGFITSILVYESSIMLSAEVSHKLLRTMTVLEMLYSIHAAVKTQFHTEASRKLIGMIVITRSVEIFVHSVLCQYCVCTVSVLCLYCVCTMYVYCMSTVCLLCAYCVYTVYILCMYCVCVYDIYNYVWCVCGVYILCVLYCFRG